MRSRADQRPAQTATLTRSAIGAAFRAAAVGPDPALVRAKGATALASPLFAGPDAVKSQARARVTQVVERLKILKKLYAANPREMARALAQAFKELKAAVKAYKEAGGRELALSGAAVSSAFAGSGPAGASPARAGPGPADSPAGASDPAAQDPTAQDPTAQDPTDQDSAAQDPADQDPAAQDPAARPEAADLTAPAASAPPVAVPDGSEAAGSSAGYGAVLTEVRRRIGEDGLEFARIVRSLSNDLSDLLEGARVQIRARRPDKATDAAFREADEGLKALRKEVEAMESDLRRDAPTAGLRLSLTA